jgi:hypothetical protein
MTETLDGVDTARVILTQPVEGWSRETYDRELDDYVATHGRLPQTITMHSETMAALGLNSDLQESPLLIASSEYDPATITLYY